MELSQARLLTHRTAALHPFYFTLTESECPARQQVLQKRQEDVEAKRVARREQIALLNLQTRAFQMRRQAAAEEREQALRQKREEEEKALALERLRSAAKPMSEPMSDAES
eukprot:6057569-Amphidinium_carterae.1